MKLSSPLRISLVIILSLVMLWFGLRRDDKLIVMKNYRFTFVNRYPKEQITNYESVMNNLKGFRLPARLQSSIFYSLSYLILATLITYLLSLSAFIAKLTAGLYGSYMILCFILIKIGTLGVDYRLSIGLSHYLEDLFLSPFFVLTLIVIIKAFGFTAENNASSRNMNISKNNS